MKYEGIALGARPLSVAVIGDRVVTRLHKIAWIDVSSRGGCDDDAQRLRRYNLAYVVDPDTQQARLDSVKVSGRVGTPEANVSLPVATYRYASASTMSGGARVLRYEASPVMTLPSGASPLIAETEKVGASLFPLPMPGSAYASLQSFTDFTGDGRPDMVFASNGKLSIAAGRPGTSFGTATQLNDNTFTRPVLDARTSDVDRFSDEFGHGPNNDYVWTQSIDVNGDGRVDVIDAAEQPNTWVLYVNKPDPTAASGIKWIRQTLDVTRLRTELRNRDLAVPASYVPLSHRVTGRDFRVWTCWEGQKGQYVQTSPSHCPAADPNVPLVGPQQHTYVEYELKDLNGDGYPDVAFNTIPVGWTVEEAPTGNLGTYFHQARQFQIGLVGAPGVVSGVDAFLNVTGLFVSGAPDPFSSVVDLIPASNCGVAKWIGQETMSDRVQGTVCSIADVNGDGIPDRIEGNGYFLGTGFGFATVRLAFPAGKSVAVQASDFIDGCLVSHATEGTAR
ncbi:MAG: VCBS repeat-containing protein, partial [Polyangiales bacterium]